MASLALLPGARDEQVDEALDPIGDDDRYVVSGGDVHRDIGFPRAGRSDRRATMDR
ncbi:hypothetical protein ABZ345_42565 [Lentzea sp. NPDC005914]|uniref:hypothetical protein n=1 Tax=Lentzea sp. NPDC005914 TaxID=3154572 RepID=UPI0033F2228F